MTGVSACLLFSWWRVVGSQDPLAGGEACIQGFAPSLNGILLSLGRGMFRLVGIASCLLDACLQREAKSRDFGEKDAKGCQHDQPNHSDRRICQLSMSADSLDPWRARHNLVITNMEF